MGDPFAPPTACPRSWKHRPCLLRVSPFASQVTIPPSVEACPDNLPMNEAGTFPFESDLFQGVAYIRVTGTTDVGQNYFNGKRRRMQAVVQGQFKKELSCADIYTGQSLNKPIKRMPPNAIVKGVIAVVRALSPGVLFDLTSDNPHALSLLVATAQALDISEKGSEPDITSEIMENTSLLGGVFTDGNMTFTQRKKLFSTMTNAQEFTYKPGLVYTFDFYQDRMDVASWSLDLGIKKFKLMNHLNRQPIQVMAMTLDRNWLYNFEIWHESLLEDDFVKHCEVTSDEDSEGPASAALSDGD